MKAEKLNSWLTLGANVGVVIGLVLLVIQIDQNTNMMQAQMNQSRTDTALVVQYAVANSDYIPAIAAKVSSGENLTREETFRYQAHFRAFNRNMDNLIWQYDHGYLEANILRTVETAVRGVIAGTDHGFHTRLSLVEIAAAPRRGCQLSWLAAASTKFASYPERPVSTH